MIPTKDWNGHEYHAFCQQQYDAARNYLKNCGRPTDDVDRFLIEQARLDVSVFGGALDRTDAVKKIRAIAALENELAQIEARKILVGKAMEVLNRE